MGVSSHESTLTAEGPAVFAMSISDEQLAVVLGMTAVLITPALIVVMFVLLRRKG